MTSPKKTLQIEKDSTLFGDLSHIEKMTTRISQGLVYDVQNITKATTELAGIQKQATFAAEDAKKRHVAQIFVFQQKIKNYMVAQKVEFGRVANQINQLIAMNKEINKHLQGLSERLQSFEKDVGL